MKKQLIYIAGLILISSFFFLSSCEDVIQVATDEAPEVLVVDAWVNNRSVTQIIKLTVSQPFFNNNFAPPAEGAIVKVIDHGGLAYNFVETEPGIYSWTPEPEQKIGVIGTSFSLSIQWQGQQFAATSKINRVPPVEDIVQEFREGELGPDGIYTQFIARDFPGRGDVYWIKTYKNGNYLNKPEEINIAYDAAFDPGAEVDGFIFITPIRELTNPVEDEVDGETPAPWVAGDEIKVEIYSLTLDAFSFMEIARDQMLNGQNGIFAQPIANSIGNVNNTSGGEKPLGVFCVSAVTELGKVIE